MEQTNRERTPQLTPGELTRGWVFFALYFAVFPFLLYVVRGILDETLNLYLSDAAANAAYYYFCTVVVLVLFFSFLKNSFYTLLDRLRENFFALGSGLAVCVILMVFVGVLPLPVENPIVYSYPEQFAASPGATVAILVLLWPLIEETLFRGLIFGGLRKYGRPLAWTLSILIFLFFKVWQFVATPSGVDLRYLLVGVQYLPMALALTWCYDVGGSVWSAILLHVILNGLGLWLLV